MIRKAEPLADGDTDAWYVVRERRFRVVFRDGKPLRIVERKISHKGTVLECWGNQHVWDARREPRRKYGIVAAVLDHADERRGNQT
jgi:hypothetical protein